MTKFGDFESFGDPLATTDDRGYVSTVWKACKAGASGDPKFAIKSYVPQRSRTLASTPEDTLENDPAQNFLAGIKELQKARRDGVPGLAPIHDFGFAEEGAWYATDFYPRKSLKAWITVRGTVDSAALQQVVHSIVGVCLALKRARGYSHGNLKPANVLLVGEKKRPLRRTPLHLADAYPASPLQLARLARDDRRVVDELLSKVMEVQDLRALGELLLQLVEGRLVNSAYDYNYPLEPSPAWEHLGRDGQRWRELCNRLLDPQLSLEKISLESLAQEFKAGAGLGKIPLVLAAFGVICLVGGGVYVGLNKKGAKPPPVAGNDAQAQAQKYEAAVAAGRTALDKKDYPTAVTQADEALKLKPGDSAATTLKKDAQGQIAAAKLVQEKEQNYLTAMAAGRTALDKKDYPTAVTQADEALKLKPGDSEATVLKKAVEGQIAVAKVAQENTQKYEAAMTAGRAALGKKDYALTVTQADEALKLKPGDSAAMVLKKDAQGQIDLALGAQAQAQKYETAMTAGRAALGKKDYAVAVTQADEALKLKPGDSAATTLKKDAQGQIAAAKLVQEKEQNYLTAMAAGRTALDKKDYPTAVTQADEALKLKPGDSEAAVLKKAAEGQIAVAKVAQENTQKYEAAMTAGRAALGKKDYALTVTQADEALKLKPGDSAAMVLKKDAEGQIAVAKLAQENTRKYEAAMTAGRAAAETKDYPTAVTQADEALKLKPGDSAATTLKKDAQGQIAAAKLVQEKEQNYLTAMAAGRTALDKKDYPTAVTQADEALKLKPGDSEATVLKKAAEGQIAVAKVAQENTQKYEAAMTAGRAALGKKDYALTVTQADEALKLKPGDSAAMVLKKDAEGQIAVAKLAQENTRKYEAAMTAGRAAAETKDYPTAVTQADEALKLKPGDSAAMVLKKAAEGQIQTANRERDFQSATADFAKGNYGAALQACEKYTATERDFETLAIRIKAEQKLFEEAKRDPGNDDYTAFGKLNDPDVMKKPPVQALLQQAEREQAELAELQDMRSQTNWPGVQTKLKILPPEKLWRKEPFENLRKWAQEEAAKQEGMRAARTAQLNNELECFKVWFGLRKKDKQIVNPKGYPEAGQQADILTALGEGKKFYKANAIRLRDQYEKPLATATDKTFKDLIRAIDAWD